MHLPPQQPNRFVNGFVEHFQGALGYPNEPKNMQNGQYYGTKKGVSIRVKKRTFRDLPPQQPNCFVNGFVEHLHTVLRYLDKPRNTQNKPY